MDTSTTQKSALLTLLIVLYVTSRKNHKKSFEAEILFGRSTVMLQSKYSINSKNLAFMSCKKEGFLCQTNTKQSKKKSKAFIFKNLKQEVV